MSSQKSAWLTSSMEGPLETESLFHRWGTWGPLRHGWSKVTQLITGRTEGLAHGPCPVGLQLDVSHKPKRRSQP